MAKEREVHLRVPHLRGGISRQPAYLRLADQVQEAVNVVHELADGTSKRPGSVYAGKITFSMVANGNYRLHSIERDDDERYLVLYGHNGSHMLVKVWEVGTDGSILASTVTISAAAQAYLDSDGGTGIIPTADDIRLVTSTDSTLIINTKVPVALTDNAEYDISASRPTFDILTSLTLNAGKYAKVRAGGGEQTDEKAEYYRYLNTGDELFGRTQLGIVTGNTATDWAAPSGGWKQQALRTMGFKVAMARIDMNITGGTWTTATKTLTKVAAFTNYVLKEGDQLYVTGGTNVTPGWYPIATRVGNDAIRLEDEITTGSTNETNVTTDAVGGEFEVVSDFTNYVTKETTMHDIAKTLEDSLQNSGATNALISWSFGGSNTKGRFTITGHWRGLGTKVFQPTSPSDAVTNYDLTLAGAPFATSTITEIATGTSSPTPDTIDPALRWTRVAAPGENDAIPDSTTMPVSLVSDTFTGDGSTPATFDLDAIEWNARVSGDAVTNPPGKMFTLGTPIADATFHDGRLALLSGERVLFSQAEDFFNFWLTDPLNITDADPIDTLLNAEVVSTGEFLIKYRTSLVAFTRSGRQFVLTEPDILSQSSARWNPSTTDKTTINLRPKSMNENLYYTGPRQDESVLFEYRFDEISLSNRSDVVSKHIKGLMPATIRSVATDRNNSMVFAVPGDCDKIYLYQPDWNGRDKVHSAWAEWQFDTNYRVVDITVIDGLLYMLVESAGQFFIEYIPVARQTIQ